MSRGRIKAIVTEALTEEIHVIDFGADGPPISDLFPPAAMQSLITFSIDDLISILLKEK